MHLGKNIISRNLVLLIVLVLAIILPIGYFVVTNTKQDNADQADTQDLDNLPSTQEYLNNDSPIDERVTTDTNQSAGEYISYSPSSLANDINIIFFAASWCPSCRSLDKDITNNLDKIPSNLTILKADYDNEQDLRVKYGITLQHTLVQVDKDGNQIEKWNGLYSLSTLEDILALI